MPQRILVLGASGYIGQHLVRTLNQQGHQILAAARHVDRLTKLQLANVSCHKVDLSWPDNLTALLKVAGCVSPGSWRPPGCMR
ncbi:NAD-dependent epimerase/dehydratase family protein, partial [Escherichia marmotae]|nr:NAD-dependent epimerase/dehydratase family protein [Escherichia marmotae]